MSITPVSRKAFAVGAECPESGRAYGITVDPLPDGTLKLVWAFMIDRAKARREGFDACHVHGSVVFDENYNGCPYCGARGFYICSGCGAMVCYKGESVVTCPVCGRQAGTRDSDEFDLKGGGY